jgi:hypothetical protein
MFIRTSLQWFTRRHQAKRKKNFSCIYNTCTYFRSITLHNLRVQKYVLLLFLPHISVRWLHLWLLVVGNLIVQIWNAFQWRDSNANCLKIHCFQRCNQGFQTHKMLLSFQRASFFLVSKESRIHDTLKTVACYRYWTYFCHSEYSYFGIEIY